MPGWVGVTSAYPAGGLEHLQAEPEHPAAGPEPEDVNIDRDILWETPARMDAEAIGAGRNPDRPAGALPFYAWIAGEAARQGAAALPGAGRGDRPEAGGVHGVLAAGEGRALGDAPAGVAVLALTLPQVSPCLASDAPAGLGRNLLAVAPTC